MTALKTETGWGIGVFTISKDHPMTYADTTEEQGPRSQSLGCLSAADLLGKKGREERPRTSQTSEPLVFTSPRSPLVRLGETLLQVPRWSHSAESVCSAEKARIVHSAVERLFLCLALKAPWGFSGTILLSCRELCEGEGRSDTSHG